MMASLHIASRDFIARWREERRSAPARRRSLEAGLALILCLAILLVAIFGDETIARAMKTVSPVAYSFFSDVTRLGESGWIFAASILATIGALALRHRGAGTRVDAMLGLFAGRAFFLLAVNAVSGLASLALKMLFGRARPRLLDMVGPFHFDMLSWKSSVLSFPSGHTVTAFASATALAFMAPRLGKWLLLLAALIEVSRVIVGAHYPSDVIAGAALGAACAFLLRRAFAARHIVFTHRDGLIEARGAGLVSSAWSGVFRTGVKR
jgi:undecaprenyl-diphosphatase